MPLFTGIFLEGRRKIIKIKPKYVRSEVLDMGSRLLGCDAVLFGRWVPAFPRNLPYNLW
jgi:hypothetical protein